ncbi:MAG: hypothetical protein EOM68_28470 [Spirochaetia bacterium]|nr:hypothetical protein [Spirochaetia bacterium]
MRGEWFTDIEEEYLDSLKGAKAYYAEAKAEFEEATEALEEAKANLERFRKKYPPDYDGPAPWY